MSVNAIPVSISGWTPTTYGVWALVIVQAFVVAGLAVKKGPEWLAAWTASRKQDAEDARLDRREQVLAESALGDRITSMEARLASFGQALSFAMNAAVISNSALEAVAPGNLAIKQSRELLGMAADILGEKDPFSKSLAKLGAIKGVSE